MKKLYLSGDYLPEETVVEISENISSTITRRGCLNTETVKLILSTYSVDTGLTETFSEAIFEVLSPVINRAKSRNSFVYVDVGQFKDELIFELN